jgi:S-DNA-T family DNA segregation ATPase FtsK/SpoIIIE
MLPGVRHLILLVIIAALLFWQWSNIKALAGMVYELLGWGGLVLVVIALSVLIVRLWQRKLSSFIFHANRWLAGVAFILALWGILAFFNLGGSFGLSIISYPAPEFIGALRLFGLVSLGVILAAPKACLRLAVGFVSWLGKQFRRQPVPKYLRKQLEPSVYQVTHPKPTVGEKPAIPPEMEKPVASPERVIPRSALVAPEKEAPPPARSQQELRQVAQEVWRKYGQSSDLITVDGWRLPPIDILDRSPEVEFGEADNVRRARIIEEALASYGVEAKVVQINAGPTVTQFGVEPGWDRKFKEVREKDKDGNIRVRLEEVSKTRVKVDRITSLANDLALALAAPSIRIEAPVPGKSVVGIEVPNTTLGLVSLRGVIESSSFQKIAARSKLSLALGKGAGGEAVAADLSRMPHLLIAGATGSGKTVCLNAIICCLLLHNTPYDVRFIMIDPKRVELTPYNSLPHLAAPVIVDTDKALSALRWLNQEMDQRYQKLAMAGARNIEGYNKNKQGEEKLPYMVLIIDELADLMMAGFDEVEHILCRLAQLARATGIHLIVATQRPSVDVVTGLIKANFPTRISFAVTSQVDSRTILDTGGAEKLLGRGDMLYMPTEAAKPKRLQGCFVSDAEVERLVYFWNSQQKEEVTQLKIEEIVPPSPVSRGGFPKDPLLDAARELARQHQHISTSFLQRRLHIGYPRAARIMEQLEEEGIKKEEG